MWRGRPIRSSVRADPHLADGASWGNIEYIACGNASPSVKRDGTATYATRMTDAYGNYNDDYTTPVAGTMPRCEYIEPHAGYMFAAYTKEESAEPNRLRWSHPAGFIEDWATDDYIDIDATGGHITGLMSFRDHLLIFKTDAIFALYGYSTESFQLVRVPGNYGAPHPQAISRSETAVYFYSSSGTNGIYAYVGSEPIYVSDKVATAMESISDIDDVWVGWIGRRLWCSIPWKFDSDDAGVQSTLIFDPSIGEGAWVVHRSALGDQTCVVEVSDRSGLLPLAAIEGSSGAACFVRLGSRDDARDQILEDATTTAFDVVYRTRWLNAGWPERSKSWRRPRLVFQVPDTDVSVDVGLFSDYNDTNQTRSGSVDLTAGEITYWRATGALETNGFDWGDGALWSGGARGATIERLTTQSQGFGLGVSPALQLRFSTNEADAGAAWGLDLIAIKYVLRRFTT